MPMQKAFLILPVVIGYFAYGNGSISAVAMDFTNTISANKGIGITMDEYLSSDMTTSMSLMSRPVSSQRELLLEVNADPFFTKLNATGRSNLVLQSFEKKLDRSLDSGRFFFFKGLKKMMWGLFVGLQIAKTILLALFLPSILGSLGKMIGKGITSVSGFNHPSETISDLDFRDDTATLDQIESDSYIYPQPEASNHNYVTQIYEPETFGHNSRFETDNQKLTHMNEIYSKNSNSNVGAPFNKNYFENFLDIPASSLLLTNYDPFYSPLLSRLDAVFQRLGLQQDDGMCREKLICFMYANPAKYAPYSNLVSAQLSRELNELRKPTIDNPDILRFFKYMKAAKNGQDGTDCAKAYKECTGLQNTGNPVMLTTFNDINKLVQARKLR